MKITFFDTETTALPNFNERARHPSQPHLCQLAWITFESGREVDSYNELIRPDGWVIPADVTAIHGITNERALASGVQEIEATSYFLKQMREADLLVAHNITFDKFLLRIAARRHELISDDDATWWTGFPSFCTMRTMTDICKLPGKFGKYKWPKLSEAYQHAFGRPLVGAHDALADVRACAELYFWLMQRDEYKPLVENCTVHKL